MSLVTAFKNDHVTSRSWRTINSVKAYLHNTTQIHRVWHKPLNIYTYWTYCKSSVRKKKHFSCLMHVQMIDLNQYENNSQSLLCYESNLATDPWIHHPNEGTSNTWQNYQKIARDKVTIFNISAGTQAKDVIERSACLLILCLYLNDPRDFSRKKWIWPYKPIFGQKPNVDNPKLELLLQFLLEEISARDKSM